MRMRQKDRQEDRDREGKRERWTEWNGSHISLLVSSEVCCFGSFSERWFGCQSIAVGALNSCRVQLPRYRWRQDEMVRCTRLLLLLPPPTLFFTVHYGNWPYPCPDFINSGAEQFVSGLQKPRLACVSSTLLRLLWSPGRKRGKLCGLGELSTSDDSEWLSDNKDDIDSSDYRIDGLCSLALTIALNFLNVSEINTSQT